jgi:glyceraldehyde 3-phosphate dehydrogenase
MFVFGVNDQTYAGQAIISNASCTTNCLAPVAKVLNDNVGHQARSDDHGACSHRHPEDRRWPVEQGLARRPRHSREHHPSSTGAAKAVGKVIPELNKKLTGMAFRVPTSDVSVVDLTVELSKPATYEDICAAMKAASEGRDEGRARLHRTRKSSRPISVARAARRCSTPKPASRSTALSSRSFRGTTTSGATPARCWRWSAS